VAIGLVPATGIPLPLFSSGGSSMLMTLTMGGILINLSRQPHLPPGPRTEAEWRG
jgi:cell division protein FtsW